ncbi:MAG TPA: general stress protein [Methylocella sp.]
MRNVSIQKTEFEIRESKIDSVRSDTAPDGASLSMDDDKQHEIARRESVPDEKENFLQDRELASEAGRKGGQSVPDKKRSFSQAHDLASEAGRKGGHAPGGNFANDPERPSEAGRHLRWHPIRHQLPDWPCHVVGCRSVT